MSERIYALLLRLYPTGFQKRYAEEALQLFRDRRRDERGFLSGLQLWLDLLGDLAVSLPREYRSAPAAVVVSQTRHVWDGTPSFQIIDAGPLGVRSLLLGGVAWLVVFSSILVLIDRGGKRLTHASLDAQRIARSSETPAKRSPTVTFSYMPANPAPGSVVTLIARVHAVGGVTASGHVRFFDGSFALNIGELKDGTVTMEGKLPRVATHALRASYDGDANYTSASSTAEKQ